MKRVFIQGTQNEAISFEGAAGQTLHWMTLSTQDEGRTTEH